MGAFEVSKSLWVAAPPARVQAQVVDFRNWRAWSPWEELDPDLERNYTGAESGVGAAYAWSGNKKAGVGSMEITQVSDRRVDVALHFDKPFPADNDVYFDLLPIDGGTQVTWGMKGETKGLMGLFTRVFSMDRLVGKDFEKGLADLKAVSEQG